MTDINAKFAAQGFICPSSSASCATGTLCDAVAGALPDITFKFVNTAGSFTVRITSEVYLFQEENQCSTLITENTDKTSMFVLGDPFFRNSTVAFDFVDKEIALFTKDVNTPIEEEVWPEALDILTYNCSMDVSDEVTYSGTITVGESSIGEGT